MAKTPSSGQPKQSDLFAKLRSALTDHKDIFAGQDARLRKLDRTLADAEAGVFIGSGRTEALANLTEGQMNRAIKKVSTEEAGVQKALAFSYNMGTEQLQTAMEDYTKSLNELYWKSTQISTGLGVRGKDVIEKQYIPEVDLLIENINKDPLFNDPRLSTKATHKAFRDPLLRYANKIKSELEKRVSISGRLSSTVKSLVRSDVVVGVLAGAASKNALVGLAAFALRQRTRSNSYASRIGLSQKGLRMRKDSTSRALEQQDTLNKKVDALKATEASETPGAPLGAGEEKPNRGKGDEEATGDGEETAENGKEAAVGGGSIEKILSGHTKLFQLIYGDTSGILKLLQSDRDQKRSSTEESALESSDGMATEKTATKEKTSTDSGKGGLFDHIKGMITPLLTPLTAVLIPTLTAALTPIISGMLAMAPALVGVAAAAYGVKKAMDMYKAYKGYTEGQEELKKDQETGSGVDSNNFERMRKIAVERAKVLGEDPKTSRASMAPKYYLDKTNKMGIFKPGTAELLPGKEIPEQPAPSATPAPAPPEAPPATPSATPAPAPPEAPPATPSATPTPPQSGFGSGRSGGAGASFETSTPTDVSGGDPTKVLEFGGESGQLQNFKGLLPAIQNKVILAGQEYLQRTGRKLKVNSAKRDSAKQKQLWDESVKAGRPGRGPTGMAIAKPGRSRHERGLAIDIQNYKDPVAVQALNKQGLFQGVPGDPVHFQLEGNPSLDQPVSPAEAATLASGAPAAPTASGAPAAPTAAVTGDMTADGRAAVSGGLASPVAPMLGGGGNIVVSNVNAPQTAVNNGGGNNMMPPVSDSGPSLRSAGVLG